MDDPHLLKSIHQLVPDMRGRYCIPDFGNEKETAFSLLNSLHHYLSRKAH